MTYEFEPFESVGTRFSPTITLAKTGGFGLSTGFHRRYKTELEGVKAIKLYFDKKNMAIGMKLLKEQETGSFKVNIRPNEGGAYFVAKSFVDAYSIDPAKYADKYTPEELDEPNYGKIFVIKIHEKKPQEIVQ